MLLSVLRGVRWALVVLVMSVVFGLTTSHDHACAHDTSKLCVPESAGEGDMLEMGQVAAGTERDASVAVAESFGIEVVGHIDPGGGFNADVVAHEDHAYLGSWGTFGPRRFCPSQGVRVYDLSDPTAPSHVSTFADRRSEPDVAGTWTEKVLVESVSTRRFTGDLAAVSFQNCMDGEDVFRGFGLYDVTDPANPTRLALVKTSTAAGGSHELYLDVHGDRVFVYTAIILSELTTSPDGVTPGDPDFQIWDVTRPDRPRQVGEWGAWAELGIHPADVDDEGAFRVNFTHSVIADGQGTAYLSYWDLGTVILDVSDPRNPTMIGRTGFDVDEEGNAHSAWTGRGGRLLVQNDEDFSPFEGGGFEEAWGYSRLYDIADPANPVPLATFEMPSTRLLPPGIGDFTVHDPKIDGNDLYLSYYAEGVVIVDIADVRAPVQKAQFVPTPAADPRGLFFPGEEFPFVWGVWLEDGYALASDINSGLWVFRLDE